MIMDKILNTMYLDIAMRIEVLNTNENALRIDRFRKIIEAQQIKSERRNRSDFVLHPWRKVCDGYVLIAYEKVKHTIMLGWMLVHIREFTKVRTLTVAHVDYISTNQNRGKGVGKRMMAVMEKKMKDCHVIELMPLPLVIGFYTKLGYRLEFKKVNYYTKWLKPRPSERLIQSYEHELELEDEKIAARIEAEEVAAFEPIYVQFTEEERRIYHEMQREDDATRIGMILTYEESNIDEVRKMLL